jgi:Mrp family chromosome partitioning ATPase
MDKSKLVSKTEERSWYFTTFIIRSRLSAKHSHLRSGIHMSDVDRLPKVIHVTSARPGEGKTTIAIASQSQPRFQA